MYIEYTILTVDYDVLYSNEFDRKLFIRKTISANESHAAWLNWLK